MKVKLAILSAACMLGLLAPSFTRPVCFVSPVTGEVFCTGG